MLMLEIVLHQKLRLVMIQRHVTLVMKATVSMQKITSTVMATVSLI